MLIIYIASITVVLNIFTHFSCKERQTTLIIVYQMFYPRFSRHQSLTYGT